MPNSNRLGDFGEDTVSQLLHRHRLGEKAPTLDFMLNLVDAKGVEYGPFFFIQVRTTGRIARVKRMLFSDEEVTLEELRGNSGTLERYEL